MRGPSKKQKTSEPKFRIHRKTVGLTYSCPTAESGKRVNDDHPVTEHAELIEFLESKGPSADWIVSKELHKSGKIHWHCWVKYSENIDTTDVLFFDVKGVHPDINKPGKGWITYCTKEKDWLSNWFGKSVAKTALSLPTAKEAIAYMWEHDTDKMAYHAHTLIPNFLSQYKDPPFEYKIYDGPYPESYYPTDWDSTTHSLLIPGPPGVGKTQLARYLLAHETHREVEYIKGKLKKLATSDFSKPILFDEINMLDQDPEQSKEITDVENGGGIAARYNDIIIPPGVPRIFCSNFTYPFKNPNEAVYGRRVKTHSPDWLPLKIPLGNHGKHGDSPESPARDPFWDQFQEDDDFTFSDP